MFENDEVSPALRNSYAVLFAVSGAGAAGATADVVAARVGLTPRSAYRHLKSLRALGLVEPAAERGRFRIGAVAAGLAVRNADQRSFLQVAQEMADKVTESVREHAHVTVYDHGTAATVAAAHEGSASMDGVVPIVLGSRRPAHASASGKVFLANSEVALTAYLLRPLESLTPFTVTDPDEFRALCAQIRDQAFATDIQENTLGVSCIAVPVLSPRGRVAASLVVSTSRPEMSPERQEELLAVLRPAASEFARKIGEKR